jgi:calcium binding protein 39
MSFLFGHRKKSPSELVKSTKKHLDVLNDQKSQEDDKIIAKSKEKISLNLSAAKFMLYGDAENEPKAAEIDKLVEDLFATNLLLELLTNIKKFEFEARKDVAQVYMFVLRQQKQKSLDFIKSHPEILETLVKGYSDSEIALNCGSILREVIRHEELNEQLLNNSELFDLFFEYVQLSTFDVASDAFATFKLMLTKHKTLSAKFLEAHFPDFVTKYNVLLQSRNYVTKRQSLKLLGELLLNRSNFNIMMKYINSADNLKIMMNLLRGNTKAIQFEAFHVFKIFVANPKKSQPVIEILVRNKRKLIEFLQKFQKEKDDDQFNEEKNTLLNTLQQLPEPSQQSEHNDEEDGKEK